MAAETNNTEQDSQIQEKTISSQTEDLKKKSGEVADGKDDVEMPLKNGNHVENESDDLVQPSDVVDDEKPTVDESNEADCGIADESPMTTETNEADSGTTATNDDENNEADSGIDEEKTPESIEADSGTMLDEAASSEVNEADSGSTKEDVAPTKQDETMATESVSSTDAVESKSSKTEETKTNGVKEKDEEKAEKKDNSLGSTVAKHYNEIAPVTKESRKHSRIFHLRNFNNWIKSVVISEFLEKVKRRKRVSDDVNILDVACGKGGDILKWQKGKVDHVIMADIAGKSIDECKERYSKLQKDQRNNRYYKERLFTAEFFVADCTKKRLNDLYRIKGVKLDMTSCQFAFHYSFESYEQADLMLRNCCENLRVGGYFIGTTPDSQKLVKYIKACKADSFGNSVFNIKPEDKESFPLFGSKYMFYLEGVVDCPEFMVYLPLLEKMAQKYNMKLVWKKSFHEIFKDYERQHASLLAKMSALEQYPASSGQQAGGSESQYKSAKDYVDKKGTRRVGTLSADEWEVAGLYIAFAFEKVEPPRKSEDKKDDKRDDKRDERKRTHERGARSDDRHHDRRKSSESTTPKRSRKDVEDEYEIKDEVYEDDEKPEDKSKSDRSSKSSSSRSRSSRGHERSHHRSSDDKSESSKSKKSEPEKSAKDDEKDEAQKADSTKEVKSAEEKTEETAVMTEETVEATEETAATTDETPEETSEKMEEAPATEEPSEAATETSEATEETSEASEETPEATEEAPEVEAEEDVPVTSTDAQDTETAEAADEDEDEEEESTTVTSTDVTETEADTEEPDNPEEPEEPMEE